MSNFYDDSKFGVRQRHWFGLTPKWGGAEAGGKTFNETQSLALTSWYPKGPIDVHRFGAMTLGTLGKGEQLFSLGIDGTATVMGTVVSSTTSAPATIASKAITDNLSAGSYLTILASTNVCSTGTVALFVDWSPRYDVDGGWDS
jgi:hypothetical protein